MSLKDRQEEIVGEFVSVTSWEDRYKKLIEMGKVLPDLPEEMKTESSKVKGCQSQVWLHASLNEKKEVEFRADSDALLVKGLVAMLLRIFSGSRPEEIMEADLSFVNTIGLGEHLTPSRSNGLMAMIKQMKYYALAFYHLQK